MAACARGLHEFLRELDQQGCDLVIASLPVEERLGLTVTNRLRAPLDPGPSREQQRRRALTAQRHGGRADSWVIRLSTQWSGRPDTARAAPRR
ncbi:Sua5 family C-terminal domain-containing protein [Streptomyces olivaceoviridis]|uniref:Sua5 family C-terminal domain-containing protein n=1 Tax=Streptomyces olivaceoviridis TaxID=1921 RepID=UPI003F4B670B